MKIGAEYVHSRQKRMFDLAVAAPLLPCISLGVSVARLCFLPSGAPSITTQDRIGANNQLFTLEKITTIDVTTGKPFDSSLATLFRSTGIDEIAQSKQIVMGMMSIVGARPLPLADRKQLLESVSDDKEGHRLIKRYMGTVALARPGLISTSGIETHAGGQFNADECITLDIEDYEKASLVYDTSLITSYGRKLIGGKLLDSRVHRAHSV